MASPRIHMICSAHLDPVWQWRWEEGCAEALATFRTAAEILREHDRLIFNHNEAVLYRWVERHDPALFEEIRDLVRAGRWWIAGGWHLQPDANLPGLESLVRQITEGRSYFRDRFGAAPRVAYNFDSFGHSGGLPQVLKLAGYRMYIHMRPQEIDGLRLPSDLYRWRGVDGSEVLGLRIAVGLYHTERDNLETRLREGVDLALKLGRDVPVFWGLGDHGGGATREDLARIDRFIGAEKRVEIVHSTTDRLLEALEEAGKEAPVVEGDLQRVFTGCYTSISRLKRRARESLGRLVETEALCAAASWLRGAPYPAEDLGEAWRDHLFNDFHDILPGSCTELAELDALDLYGKVSESARRLRLASAVALGSGMMPPGAIPVTVLSANPSLKLVPVEAECMLDYRPRLEGAWHLRLFTSGGREVPCQEEQPESLLPFNGWRRKVSFLDELPGLGSKAYRIEVFPGKKEPVEARPALAHRLDSGSGLVASIPACGGECLAGPLFQALVVKDEGDSWGADWWRYRDVAGRFELRPGGPRAIAKGPIRAITESVFTYGQSRIVLHTVAYTGWPVLEFRLRIHWSEERKRLKLSVPAAFKDPILRCEVPGGMIERPADGEEHVHGRWFLVEGELDGRRAALGVVQSGQHGLDFSGGEVRLSVLRGAAYCHEKGFPLGGERAWKFMDQGVHEVRLLVTAGEPERVLGLLPGLADWLDAPPAVYSHLPAGVHPGRGGEAPDACDLLSLSPSTIRMAACKRSEDGAALIIRLHETAGVPTRAVLKFGPDPVEARLDFHPFELKTLRLERSGRLREADLVGEF